jgi:ADP-ribose pyrophosphatase YjhB (NUDIX family)/ubiquinone/menaquinone biosynthesis C-methylase UbiE
VDETTVTTASYDRKAADFAARWFDLRLDRALTGLGERLRPGARVLDMGCGPGRDVRFLGEMGFQAVGLDRSAGMLAEARRRVTAPFVQADMRALPFADGSFDGVWACASLLHVPRDEAPGVLAEVHRVVEHGHLFLTVKRGEGEAWVESEHGPRFFTYYHPAEVELLVERAGFRVLEQWENPDQTGREHPWVHVVAWTKVITPRVGAGAAVFDEAGRLLLVRREDNGYWSLPGGHLDYGETLAQTATREIREETGLDVRIERLSGIYSAPYPDGFTINGVNQMVVATFIGRVAGGALRLSPEITDAAFFPPDALPEPIMPTHVRRIHHVLRGGNGVFYE